MSLLQSLERLIRFDQATINFFFLTDMMCDSCTHLTSTALVRSFKSSEPPAKGVDADGSSSQDNLPKEGALPPVDPRGYVKKGGLPQGESGRAVTFPLLVEVSQSKGLGWFPSKTL